MLFLNFLKTFQNLLKLRKLGKIYSFNNIISFVFFMIWRFEKITSLQFQFFFYFFIFLNFFLGFIFIFAGSIYGKTKWYVWGIICLCPFCPFGIILFFYCWFNIYWEIKENTSENNEIEKEKIFNYDMIKLKKTWTLAMQHLLKIDEKSFVNFLTNFLKIKNNVFEEWTIFQITTVIALFITTKQIKEKTFQNLIINAHWYDAKHFTFSIKNTKTLNKKNPYPLSASIIVLDEIRNYQKILNSKLEIKENLKFSPSKIISLHWGNEYKVYINE